MLASQSLGERRLDAWRNGANIFPLTFDAVSPVAIRLSISAMVKFASFGWDPERSACSSLAWLGPSWSAS